MGFAAALEFGSVFWRALEISGVGTIILVWLAGVADTRITVLARLHGIPAST
jgi:hypothetical protein